MEIIAFARTLMMAWPSFPPNTNVHLGLLEGIFDHGLFLVADEVGKKRIMLESSDAK